MALLSIYRGTQAEVSERPVSDGALLFATDTKKIYLDKGSSRVIMSSLQDLSDYVTYYEVGAALEQEASARQTQDQLLEQAISDIGTVAVQSSTPTDSNVKIWIQI